MNPEILETIINRLSPIPLYIGLIIAIFFLAKFMKMEKLEIKLSDSRKSAFLMFSALFYSVLATISAVKFISEKELFLTWSTIGFIALENFIVFILPVMVILRAEGFSLEYAGVTKKNFKKALLLSMSLLLLFALFLNIMLYTIFSKYAFLGLIKALVIATGEEIYFRGFLQLRCQALFGNLKGAVLSTLLFGLYHLPIIVLFEGTIPFVLAVNLLTTLIFGSFQAILMHKSQNVVAPTLFHAFINWYPNL